MRISSGQEPSVITYEDIRSGGDPAKVRCSYSRTAYAPRKTLRLRGIFHRPRRVLTSTPSDERTT